MLTNNIKKGLTMSKLENLVNELLPDLEKTLQESVNRFGGHDFIAIEALQKLKNIQEVVDDLYLKEPVEESF
jgi:hypothetical protein